MNIKHFKAIRHEKKKTIKIIPKITIVLMINNGMSKLKNGIS